MAAKKGKPMKRRLTSRMPPRADEGVREYLERISRVLGLIIRRAKSDGIIFWSGE